MKIKIHKNDLLHILNIIETGLTSNNVIKSLKGIKITINKETVSFLTSKSEMAINFTSAVEKLDIEILKEGEIIIPGLEFINIIKKLNSSYINLEQDNNILNIKTNKSHIQLISLDKNSYPLIKFELTDPKIININKHILQEGYNKTKYSIDNNPINPILTGINFNFKDELKISSTDSLRMTFYKTDIILNEDINFTINKNLLKDLNKILDYEDTNDIELLINNNQILIKTDNLKLKLRLLDGNYPDIEKIIPKNINFSFEINKQTILESLDRVVLLTEKNESIVICNIQGDILHLKSSHKYLGKIEEQCNIKSLHGNPFKIAFDPHFVLESLNTLEEEDIKFEFIDEISGFIIKNKESDNIINVISPIRIN